MSGNPTRRPRQPPPMMRTKLRLPGTGLSSLGLVTALIIPKVKVPDALLSFAPMTNEADKPGVRGFFKRLRAKLNAGPAWLTADIKELLPGPQDRCGDPRRARNPADHRRCGRRGDLTHSRGAAAARGAQGARRRRCIAQGAERGDARHLETGRTRRSRSTRRSSPTSSWWSASTAPARPRPSANWRIGCSPRDAA